MLLAGIALCIPLLSFASEKLFVQVPAVLDPAAPIVDSVKNQCGVEMLIGNHVFEKVSQYVDGTTQLQKGENAGQSPVLRLTILSVHGFGGGSWSGAKSITIHAQLVQNGQTIQSTVLTRGSRGGPLGGFSGTCAIMERIARTLGKDVANWLPEDKLSSQTQPSAKIDLQPNKDQSDQTPAAEQKALGQ